MAEFPNLGKHCGHPQCNLLDFLPIKCYGCDTHFCAEHFKADSHDCDMGLRDARVPVCPLCDQPVPVGKSEDVNAVVGLHIDNDCRADPSRQKRAYTNRCSLPGCKRKEAVPFTCRDCRSNFCVRHRHGADHNCTKTAPATKPKQRHAPSPYDLSALDQQLAQQLQMQEEREWHAGHSAQENNRCVIS